MNFYPSLLINKFFSATEKISFYVVSSLLLGIVLVFNQPDLNRPLNINESDSLEYQMMAVNLVSQGVFPSIAFLNDYAAYQIDSSSISELSSKLYYQIVTQYPLSHNFSKPPLYTLFVSLFYWCFGIDLQIIRVAQIFLVTLVAVAQIYAARTLLGNWGIMIGGVSASFYLSYILPQTTKLYPHLLVEFLLMFTFLLLLKRGKQMGTGWLIGILLGLMMLTNGNTIFLCFLYFLFLFIRAVVHKNWKIILKPALSFVAILIPWIVYANIIFANMAEERTLWLKQLNEEREHLKYTGEGILDREIFTPTDSVLIKAYIIHIYSKLGEKGFITLSKQPYGDEILGTQNEYCADGRFHPEWRFLQNSYYNLHPSAKSPLLRIVDFYCAHPEFIVKNIIGKFSGTTNPYSLLYYLFPILVLGYFITLYFKSPLIVATIILLLFLFYAFPYWAILFVFLFGLFLLMSLVFGCSSKFNFYELFFIFTLSNTALITLVFLGESRYVQIVNPFLIPLSTFYVVKILQDYFKPLFHKWKMGITTFFLTYLIPLRMPEVVLMSGYFIIAFLFAYHPYLFEFQKVLLIYIAILFYVASVYTFNSYADYAYDLHNPRLKMVGRLSKTFYLRLTFLFLGFALVLSFWAKPLIALLIFISFLLWVAYYAKGIRLKSGLLGGTLIHFVAGIFHFMIGYEALTDFGFIARFQAIFFALLLSLGHINHELIDFEADKKTGVKSSAVRLGAKPMTLLFNLIYLLSHIYWGLLWYWGFIDVFEFGAFFNLPWMLLYFWIRFKKEVLPPIERQKFFRWALLFGGLFLVGYKLLKVY